MLFSLLYNVPLVILFISWLLCRKQEQKNWQPLKIFLDMTIICIAVSRFYGVQIPPSGHALFLTYSLITINNRYYRAAALMMLLVTIALKISWGDYQSWSYGILLGAVTGTLWILIRTKPEIKHMSRAIDQP
jgi:hypothetical protein